jgi:hypothetical protein
MRKIILLGIAGLLTLTAVAAWSATHGRPATRPAGTAAAMDPLAMMAKAKDLPVHIIKDAF